MKINLNNINVIAIHKADKFIPIVSTASILAKIIRDLEIERLKRIYGDFGSGYPSDEKTRKFIKDYYVKYGKLPDIVRKSWKTIKNIINEIHQLKLYESNSNSTKRF